MRSLKAEHESKIASDSHELMSFKIQIKAINVMNQ